jgi:hypothetical protein
VAAVSGVPVLPHLSPSADVAALSPSPGGCGSSAPGPDACLAAVNRPNVDVAAINRVAEEMW